MRLSALMVNHGSGALALACARSLAREWAASGFAPGDLELVVVDHPAGTDELRWLGELERAGARVIHASENAGYAGGIQAALAASSGGPEDLVAVLNPDVVFLPGSITALVDRLMDNPLAGAVAPRAWLDPGCTFQLPAPLLPTGAGELLEVAAGRSRWLARLAARRRSRHDWQTWTARAPLARHMLPGACLFLHRGVVDDLGLLLDPSYPLYYEDADLARRLYVRGLELELVPAAGVLHHGARSSGVGEDFEAGPRRRWRIARRVYLERYAAAPWRAALALAERLCARFPRAPRPAHGLRALPLSNDPPTIQLPAGGPWRLELSLTPTFGFALGAVAEGGAWSLPRVAWDWLFAGRYYVRALAPSGRVLGAWTFAKHGPPSAEPVFDVDRVAARDALEAGARAAAEAQGGTRCA